MIFILFCGNISRNIKIRGRFISRKMSHLVFHRYPHDHSNGKNFHMTSPLNILLHPVEFTIGRKFFHILEIHVRNFLFLDGLRTQSSSPNITEIFIQITRGSAEDGERFFEILLKVLYLLQDDTRENIWIDMDMRFFRIFMKFLDFLTISDTDVGRNLQKKIFTDSIGSTFLFSLPSHVECITCSNDNIHELHNDIERRIEIFEEMLTRMKYTEEDLLISIYECLDILLEVTRFRSHELDRDVTRSFCRVIKKILGEHLPESKAEMDVLRRIREML